MIKIYHNPRCSKSRAGLLHLKELTTDFEIIDYLKTGLTVDELKQIFNILDKSPEEMVRKHEQLYKENYKRKEFSDEEWIGIMAENPKLLNRPIIIKDKKAVWGNPVENIDSLF